MFSRCSGYAPQFRRVENSFPTMPDTITQNTSINPIIPFSMESNVSADPSTARIPEIYPMPTMPATPVMPSMPAMPSMPSPSDDSDDTYLVHPTPITPGGGPSAPSNPMMPEVLPEAPLFKVPSNPLLPPQFQEILSYESLQYLGGFLRTQIGKTCEVQFLIGSNITESRRGVLIGVGLNYILLQDIGTREVTACDFYSIKFVEFDISR